jgi:hypothetical protein
MGLDVYFRRDIANVLRATACASEGSVGLALELVGERGALASEGTLGHDSDPEKLLQVYRQGVRHALISVGLAFGLEPVGAGAQPRPGVSPPLAGLLWAEAPYEP